MLRPYFPENHLREKFKLEKVKPMPVVFDEVQGTVVSDETEMQSEGSPPAKPQEPEPEKFNRLWRQRERRMARLRAD